MLLSVPQRLYQSPGPHTPLGCVAAINVASQTERFVVSSISTYVGVGSNTDHGKHGLRFARSLIFITFELTQKLFITSIPTLFHFSRDTSDP